MGIFQKGISGGIFFNVIFLEGFFCRIFLGGFFWEDYLGGILWEEIGIDLFVKILVFVKILSQWRRRRRRKRKDKNLDP